MKYPKVLVSSIDVWNTESGSDTFTNLLSGYDSEKIANIYFRSGIPTSEVANSYFFISENAVIKSIFRKDITTGWKTFRSGNEKDIVHMNDCKAAEKKQYSFFTKHRWVIFLFAREVLWKLGAWKSRELDEFIEEFDPDILFCPIESYIHFNRINEYIAHKKNIPIIGYMWDDNYSYMNCSSIGAKIYRFFLRKSVFRILNNSEKVFVISSKMQKELKTIYGINSEVLTKGALTFQNSDYNDDIESPIEIIYTGKLVYGRLETIQGIAEVIKKLNTDGIVIKFKIYSGTVLNSNEIKMLSGKGVQFCGSVSQKMISSIQRKADVLLMVEALAGKHKYDARVSFSTKIVDYLASGKCIIAVGPSDIAPVEYLQENDLAIVCSDISELERILLEKLTPSNMKYYADKCRKFAKKEHNLLTIQAVSYTHLR